jgi:hypothetical protein
VRGCAHPWCSGTHYARGLCAQHWSRVQEHVVTEERRRSARPILFGGAIFDARPNGDQWTESVSYRPAEVFTPEPEEEATS